MTIETFIAEFNATGKVPAPAGMPRHDDEADCTDSYWGAVECKDETECFALFRTWTDYAGCEDPDAWETPYTAYQLVGLRIEAPSGDAYCGRDQALETLGANTVRQIEDRAQNAANSW